MSEIQVRLPDGKLLAVPAGATVLSVAERIGKGLARAALAGRIDGRLVDLRVPLHENVSLEIVTARDPAGAAVIRHSAEHVMADAVKRLFPSAQIDVGRTDHSEKFQYDFRVERPFTPEDLEQIEKEMAKIIAEKAVFTREVMSRSAAQALFEAQGEALKVSRLADIPEGRGDHRLPARRLRRSVPRAARAAHGPDRRLRADRERGLVLARRRAQSDAATHLWDGLRDAQGARRAPRAARRSAPPRPPARRRRARALPPRRDGARLAVLPAQGRGCSTTASSTTCAPCIRATASPK